MYEHRTVKKIQSELINSNQTVTDPGFPVGGGIDLVGGGPNSRGSYVSKNLYVETKESGPLASLAPPPKIRQCQKHVEFLQINLEGSLIESFQEDNYKINESD